MRAPRWCREHGADDGYSLIEVIVSSAIIFIVALGVISALGFSTMSSQMAAARGRATNLANLEIEDARNVPYDNLGTKTAAGVYQDPPGDILTTKSVGEFTVETRIWWQFGPDMRALYKNLTVTVLWTRPMNGRVTVSTSIFGKTMIANSGPVEIRVLEYDAPNEPVIGALVTLDPAPYMARSASTDESGALFAQVPAGDVGVTVSAPGYLIGPEELTKVTVVADTLCSAVVKVQHPSTLRVHIDRSSGVAVAGSPVSVRGPGASMTTYSGTTNADGEFEVPGLVLGNYSVTAGGVTRSIALEPPSGQVHDEYFVVADPSTINVRVTSGSTTGPAVSGVALTLRQSSTLGTANTDGSGNASFTGVLTTGVFSIDAAATGYFPTSLNVDVPTAGLTYTVNLVVTPSGSIVVYVRSGSTTGALLSGATVALTPSSPAASKTTTQTGVASFGPIAIGTYTVTATLANHTNTGGGSQTVAVVEGGVPTQVTLWLVPPSSTTGTIHIHTYDRHDNADRQHSAGFWIMNSSTQTHTHYTTPESGEMDITGVALGTYTAQLDYNGESPVTITVAAGGTTPNPVNLYHDHWW